MKTAIRIAGIGLACLGTALTGFAVKKPVNKQSSESWTAAFTEDTEFSSTGANTCFILQPGYWLEFEGKEDGADVHLIIKVLDETRQMGNIETRVIEESETKNGQLEEVSRNYYAFGKQTQSIYYFGEDVDMYEGGKVVGHGGSWHAFSKGASYGLMMPGINLLGARYYQEVAPGAAKDRAEVIALGMTVHTPAGDFKNCIKTEETTPLEPNTKEYKVYAPSVGLVKDGALTLVKYGSTP